MKEEVGEGLNTVKAEMGEALQEIRDRVDRVEQASLPAGMIGRPPSLTMQGGLQNLEA